jgi:cellulose synthase/poly-beta-1,6-N-acetylglucosamine synthase-like glycosyltransferase
MCSPLKVNQRFEGTCRLHLQRRISQETSMKHVSKRDLKMEAICSSETSVDFQQTTRRYIHKIWLHDHRCQNVTFYKNLPCFCGTQRVITVYMNLTHFDSILSQRNPLHILQNPFIWKLLQLLQCQPPIISQISEMASCHEALQSIFYINLLLAPFTWTSEREEEYKLWSSSLCNCLHSALVPLFRFRCYTRVSVRDRPTSSFHEIHE